MLSRTRQVGVAGRVAFVTLMLTAVAVSQGRTQPLSTPNDVFSSIHENLREAADRALADTLENQVWMNAPGSPTMATQSSSVSRTNSIVKLRAAIDRVSRLQPVLEPILRSEGVPVELSAVVLVESGGLTTALSPKGAGGAWQFMPETARRYGLLIDGSHDDRVDIVKSTHAAARYLRDLHIKFGDWSLALAAYNAGEAAVSDAIRHSPSADFEAIRESGRVPLETLKYVPAIRAAMSRLQYGNFKLNRDEAGDRRIVYASSAAAE